MVNFLLWDYNSPGSNFLKDILTKPKNSIIKQYKKLFKYDNITFDFDKKVYDYLVDKSMEYDLVDRGLK